MLNSGNSILSARTRGAIGARTGGKLIAAAHRQCRSWIILDVGPCGKHFRFSPNNEHLQTGPACLKGAKDDIIRPNQ